jgi:hypothetical protein
LEEKGAFERSIKLEEQSRLKEQTIERAVKRSEEAETSLLRNEHAQMKLQSRKRDETLV